MVRRIRTSRVVVRAGRSPCSRKDKAEAMDLQQNVDIKETMKCNEYPWRPQPELQKDWCSGCLET